MASTNKTTHYNLSQYIGTDKPTYLVDYNQDMERIDTGIYGADSKATLNSSSIGTLSNLTTTAKTDLVSAVNEVNSSAVGVGDISQLTTSDKTSVVAAVNEVDKDIGNLTSLNTVNKTSIVAAVNEVDGDVGNLANLTTQTQTSLVGAVNEVKSLIENFNLTNFTTITKTSGGSEITTTSGSIIDGSSLTIAKNSDGSLAKVYGNIFINNPGIVGSVEVSVPNSGLIPNENININNAGIYLMHTDNISDTEVVGVNLTIQTNGTLKMSIYSAKVGGSLRLTMLPQLYFVKDFGDTPTI